MPKMKPMKSTIVEFQWDRDVDNDKYHDLLCRWILEGDLDAHAELVGKVLNINVVGDVGTFDYNVETGDCTAMEST